MSKHTPGPWTWLNEPYDDGKPYITIEAGDGLHGGNDCGFWFQGIMSEANARLIASAPELLAALEAMIEPWSEHDAARLSGLAGYGALDEQHRTAILNARAAIAKAKGETP